MRLTVKKLLAVSALALLFPQAASASGVSEETAFLFNTLLLLLSGILVMFMAAGFAMLEAGMVRSKSVAVILAKNIALYSVASLVFYAAGYQLMYGESLFGVLGKFAVWAPDDTAALAGDFSAGQSSAAIWFFQMVFVATAASIVSGSLAERIKFWPFVIFIACMTGAIYPIVGHWTWGGGWLSELGFADFAGSTIVHSVGGWAALIGICLLGPRLGRFDRNGKVIVIPPSSLPHVALGTFILWMGWFGFNGGSQLAFSSTADAVAVAKIFVNTNAAAAGGVMATMLASQLVLRRLDLPLILNGALAGLVSITAEPLLPSVGLAIAIGGIGALLMMGASRVLELFKLDDVVGAIPVHLVAGIWGTLAVALTNTETSLLVQGIGVAAVAVFTCAISLIIWLVLKLTLGIRLGSEHEERGGDLTEIGLRAYNLH